MRRQRRAQPIGSLIFTLKEIEIFLLSMTPEILEDILRGLIKNAIESTPDEGSIRIILAQKDERLLLKVQDSGIGITEDNQKRIFDGLFHTLDTERYNPKNPTTLVRAVKALTSS